MLENPMKDQESNHLPEKMLEELNNWFSLQCDSCLVAFSGGVDSALLAFSARKVLSHRAVAVFSVSPAVASPEIEYAKTLAEEIGILLEVVTQDDLGTPEYVANSVSRCYFCRNNLASEMAKIGRKYGINTKVDGTHIEDMNAPRPGIKALREAGFRAPFVELHFGKDDVRAMARVAKLSNAERPSEACLSSRVAYGQKIDLKTLEMISKAEGIVRELTGASIVRVRTIGKKALVEVDIRHVRNAFSAFDKLRVSLLNIGYEQIEISEDGYVSGRMLELFTKAES